VKSPLGSNAVGAVHTLRADVVAGVRNIYLKSI